MSNIFVGQSALRIQLTTGQVITGALSLKIQYKNPAGTTGEWTATSGGDLTGIIYKDLAVATDLSVAGTWKFWAYVKFSDGREAYGDVVEQMILIPGN